MARKGGKDRGLFQRDGVWWIRWTCSYGCDHRERIGPKAKARDEYQRRKVAVKTEDYCLTRAEEAKRRAKPTLFLDAADRYLAWAKQDRPRSYMFREKALKHLTAAFGDKTLAEITRVDVEVYQNRRRDGGAAPATVNRERSVLSHLFNRAASWGLAEANPTAGMERQRESDEKPRPLTYDEEARLFIVLPEHYKPFVTFALHTGLRLGELRAQAWRDVENGTLKVTRPKSGKAETIPLNTTAKAVLGGLERKSPLLFPSMPTKLSDLFVRYTRKAKLEDVTFHCLRDTYISRLAPHVSGPVLMALARHRDYRTTRRYVQVDGEHLRAAVEQLSVDVPTGDPILNSNQPFEILGVEVLKG